MTTGGGGGRLRLVVRVFEADIAVVMVTGDKREIVGMAEESGGLLSLSISKTV